MSVPKIDLIRQALSASESSIRLARQLLNELEKEKGSAKQNLKELPGVVGIFDGQNMVTESGEKISVPENYASKSILVVGDTLKLVNENGEKRFKQIEHVKRLKTTGILTKKDGKWVVVASEGSYRVLPASVSHFNGEVGDEVLLQLPANNLQVPWAGVEKITKKIAASPKPAESKIEKSGEGKAEKSDQKAESNAVKQSSAPAVKNEKIIELPKQDLERAEKKSEEGPEKEKSQEKIEVKEQKEEPKAEKIEATESAVPAVEEDELR